MFSQLSEGHLIIPSHLFSSMVSVFKLIILKEALTLCPSSSTSSSSRRLLFFRSNVCDLPQKWRSGRLEAIWTPCCNKHAINPELVQPICHTQQSDAASVWSWACEWVFQDPSVHPRYIRLTPGPENFRPHISLETCSDPATVNNSGTWFGTSGIWGLIKD